MILKISPFKMNMFIQCPRRYKYHYVDSLIKQYKKDWPRLTMGQNVHATLFDLFEKTPPQSRNYERAEAILRLKWSANHKGFKDKDEERKYGLTALSQLRKFCESENLGSIPFRLEKFHEARLDAEVILNGKIDRIDKLPDGSLHIIDYKTGEISRESDDLQLVIYYLLVSLNFSLPIAKVSNLYLDNCEYYTITPTRGQIDATIVRIKEVAKQIAIEKEFQAKVGPLCKFCDFVEICDEGQNYCGQ